MTVNLPNFRIASAGRCAAPALALSTDKSGRNSESTAKSISLFDFAPHKPSWTPGRYNRRVL
ncbi:MAG TPA: hypothetical protein VFN13_11140 [Rudaea sp.]|nr:hypothetical protein [Rudaea sp.]